jgi:phytanoyl-CoA hydroxylase
MALTQEQIDFFHENGYLRWGKLLDDAQIELLRREYDAEFEKENREKGGATALHDPSASPEQRQKWKMLQIINMLERNIHFRRLDYDPRILDIVEDLIGPNIQLFHDQALYKPAFHGGPVSWHQDNAYWHCKPANLVSCWITLDDVVRENGAMQVIPGSHLKPVWHGEIGSQGHGVLFDVEKHVDKRKAVVIDLPAGGVMFHHCQTLHYTAPNETPNQRRAFAIHFMVPGTRSESPHVKDLSVGFSRPILRMRI